MISNQNSTGAVAAIEGRALQSDGDRGAWELALMGLLHDMKNAIYHSAASAKLLSRSVDARFSPEEHECWNAHQRSIARMSEMSSNLMGMISRIIDSSSPFDLRPPVEKTCREQLEIARHAGVMLAWRLPLEKVQMRGSSDCLQCALRSLIDNGIDACAGREDASVTIDFRMSAGGSRLSLSVTDNGPGIPADMAELIFKRGCSTKGSTGMGLWLAQQAAGQLGGWVELRGSHPGRTTFVLEFVTHAHARSDDAMAV